jgi:hypothetical protein
VPQRNAFKIAQKFPRGFEKPSNAMNNYPKYNIRAKQDGSTAIVPNREVAKLHSFKILKQNNQKTKHKDRLSHSGSNKTGRPISSQIPQKKRLKTTKGKQPKSKGDGGFIWVPKFDSKNTEYPEFTYQFPNNMRAAKALLEFKNKLENSEEYKNKDNAQELLKEYIRKFMKDNDYQKHFEPAVTKIINEYGLVINSIDMPFTQSYNTGNSLSSNVKKKRISSQDKLNSIIEKIKFKVTFQACHEVSSIY